MMYVGWGSLEGSALLFWATLKLHTRILLGMALGVVVGLALRAFAGDLSAPAPESWLAPFVLAADIFLRLLKLLIVPLILTSIVTGISGIGGGRDFGRLKVLTQHALAR